MAEADDNSHMIRRPRALLRVDQIDAQGCRSVVTRSLTSNLPQSPPKSLPGSYSYLLTPPSSLPDLSRSYSTTSIDSAGSVASSQYGKSPRRLSVHREEVDLDLEDPLYVDEEDDGSLFFGTDVSTSPETPTRRRSSLGMLLRPLKAVVSPSTTTASMVSALTANLSAWATSLASTQFDERYGLLPSTSHMQSTSGRSYSVPLHMPRPVQTSGPQHGHSTIFEAEMERPLLADEYVRPVSVELQPWSKVCGKDEPLCSNDETIVAAAAATRPREPRLNPDFLRILVLETNMRRLGKISAGTGRARMILSPRVGESRSSRLRCSTVIAV